MALSVGNMTEETTRRRRKSSQTSLPPPPLHLDGRRLRGVAPADREASNKRTQQEYKKRVFFFYIRRGRNSGDTRALTVCKRLATRRRRKRFPFLLVSSCHLLFAKNVSRQETIQLTATVSPPDWVFFFSFRTSFRRLLCHLYMLHIQRERDRNIKPQGTRPFFFSPTVANFDLLAFKTFCSFCGTGRNLGYFVCVCV